MNSILTARILATGTTFIALAGLGFSDTPTLSNPSAQTPAPVNTFELNAGYLFNYLHGSTNQSYYNVSYLGKMLSSAGTPFQYAQSLDLTAPSVTTPFGDANSLDLEYQKGVLSSGGGLFSALGLTPLNFRGISSLRGTAFVGGDDKGQAIQYAAGLETPPAHLAFLSKLNFTNWAIVGVNAQHQQASNAAAGDTNYGLATYKLFLGQSFLFHRTANLDSAAGKMTDAFLKEGTTLDTVAASVKSVEANATLSIAQKQFIRATVDPAAVILNTKDDLAKEYKALDPSKLTQVEKNWLPTVTDPKYGAFYVASVALGQEIGAKPEAQRTQLEQTFLDGIASFNKLWQGKAAEYARGAADAMTEQPTFSFYAEDTGYYAFTGTAPGGKLRNLGTITLDYFFLPTRDDVVLRLRYENGYQRSAPTVQMNHLMLSVALKF